MMKLKIKILDQSTLGDDISFIEIESLGEVSVYKTSTPNEVIDRIKDADVIIINKIKITKEILSYAKKLKLICLAATGYDNVDIESCKEKGVGVCNVIGYSTHSVAQVTLAMVLSLCVNLKSFNKFVENSEYQNSGIANKLTPVYHEMFGKTWGIVGYGNIGKQVGRVALALGCNIIVNKKTPDNDVKCVDIKTLCKEADIITIHTPLNNETKGLINEEMLSLMKKDVIIVNTARGLVTNEEAIAKAILDNKIGGFGTDVYSKEPFPNEHPFNKIKNLDNVILTPHMAWGSYESRERCIKEIAKNIMAFYNNEIRNRIDLIK